MFYGYNSIEFGKKLKAIRLDLKLTQEQVSYKVGLSVDGIRKIENGFVTPKFESLVKLSLVYKTDLLKIVSHYSKILSLMDYYKNLDTAIDNEKIEKIEVYKLKIYEDFKDYIAQGLINLSDVEQFVLFCDASYNFLLNKPASLVEAKKLIISALKLTEPNIDMNRLALFKFNSFEVRFLHLYALTERRLNNTADSLRVIKYLISIAEIDENNTETLKNINSLYFSASYTHYEIKEYGNSLYYANLGLEISKKYKRFNELHLLYYRKGMAEYFLGMDNFQDALKKSVTLLDIMSPELAEKYRSITLNLYGIVID